MVCAAKNVSLYTQETPVILCDATRFESVGLKD